MYKCIHAETGEEIISLNPAWLKQTDRLRALDHADQLVCQGCRQAVRLKAGAVKRPHFAHKHRQACAYGTESPEILNARAVLYEWLLGQFSPALGAQVTVEKQLPESGLPRPVDCWVETPTGPLAYWIIEAGIKIEPRTAIKAAFARLAIPVHYIFLAEMLNEARQEFHSALLTPTERVFMTPTLFDQAAAGRGEVGSTLHYLNADPPVLTTYRGLLLFHRPNWYKGLKKTSPLAAVRADRRSGEPVHPGEAERLGAFAQRRQRLDEKRRRWADRANQYVTADEADEIPGPPPADSPAPEPPRERWGRGAPVKPAEAGPPALPCAICGQITDDYWSTFVDDYGRRLCRCRACLERE